MALVRSILRLHTAARRSLPAVATTVARRSVSTHGTIHDQTPAKGGPRRPMTTQGVIHDQPRERQTAFDVHHDTTKDALRKMIVKLPMNRTIVTHPLLSNWLNHHENNCPYFYATNKEGELAGFALLHKTEAMAQTEAGHGEHIPHALDLVYVMPQFRSEGLAHILLQEAVKHYRIHCFCPDNETAELLSLCGFTKTSVAVDRNPGFIHMTYP